MKKKNQIEHQQQIDDLISQLVTEQDAQGPTLESIRRINRISTKLQKICGCLYYEHFEPPPLVIKKPYTLEEFGKFIGKAISSNRDYQVINEDGKTTLSGGGLYEFEHCMLCPVCYKVK